MAVFYPVDRAGGREGDSGSWSTGVPDQGDRSTRGTVHEDQCRHGLRGRRPGGQAEVGTSPPVAQREHLPSDESKGHLDGEGARSIRAGGFVSDLGRMECDTPPVIAGKTISGGGFDGAASSESGWTSSSERQVRGVTDHGASTTGDDLTGSTPSGGQSTAGSSIDTTDPDLSQATIGLADHNDQGGLRNRA